MIDSRIPLLAAESVADTGRTINQVTNNLLNAVQTNKNNQHRNALLELAQNKENRTQEVHNLQFGQAQGQQLHRALKALEGTDANTRSAQIEFMAESLGKFGFDDDDRQLLSTDQGLKQAIQITSQFSRLNDDNTPSDVRSFQFFQNLSTEDQEAFLRTKRAGQTGKIGDVQGNINPLNGNFEPLTEGRPDTQENIQGKISDQQATKAAKKEAAISAIKKSKEAFERIAPIRKNIANFDEAIRLIDEGAETGVVASRLPSVRQASIELDSLQGRLGLDVIGNTTFGALSEAELRFALDTACLLYTSPSPRDS